MFLSLTRGNKAVWFYILLVCWLFALWVWRRVDRSMDRLALEAISEEEDAAASIGIDVSRTKLKVTVLSAAMTCLGGVLYAQYQLYVNPETVSGIGISLRILVGNDLHGVDLLIYGALLILFIIYMPRGILGTVLDRFRAK